MPPVRPFFVIFWFTGVPGHADQPGAAAENDANDRCGEVEEARGTSPQLLD
jgi:hypothetical protein